MCVNRTQGTDLVHSVGRLLARQAVEGWHSGRRDGGCVDGQPVVEGRQRGQGGLTRVQRHGHGLADVQRLVEGQSAQAVGVEAVRRE